MFDWGHSSHHKAHAPTQRFMEFLKETSGYSFSNGSYRYCKSGICNDLRQQPLPFGKIVKACFKGFIQGRRCNQNCGMEFLESAEHSIGSVTIKLKPYQKAE